MVRLRGGVAAVALVLVAATGCELDNAGGSAGPGEVPGGGGAAFAAAEALTVKGRAPRTGYDRDEFGSPWADTDSNSCDTRDDILKRDLEDVRFRDDDCTVVSGVLDPDPYTGEDVPYVRGRSKIDVDHIVALSDAWQKAPSSGTTASASPWPTTRSTCWRSTPAPTAARATVTRPPGCRRTRPTAAPMWQRRSP